MDSVFVLSPVEVPVTIALNGPVGSVPGDGSVAASTNCTLPLAATGPVSGMPSLLLSINGVTPSAAKNLKVVPAGKVPRAAVRFTTSVALPVLNTVCVNFTVAPMAALATVVVSAAVVLGLPTAVSSEVVGLPEAEPSTMPKVPMTL
ncbi:hypothetical protein D3C72_1056430 [compost metagenome]